MPTLSLTASWLVLLIAGSALLAADPSGARADDDAAATPAIHARDVWVDRVSGADKEFTVTSVITADRAILWFRCDSAQFRRELGECGAALADAGLFFVAEFGDVAFAVRQIDDAAVWESWPDAWPGAICDNTFHRGFGDNFA